MPLWWDKDKTERSKGLTCKHCVTHPELVQTGHGDPLSLKCPVCKDEFDSKGIKYDEEEYNNQMRFDLEEEMEDIWNSIWGKP